jgi:hypothetical protein
MLDAVKDWNNTLKYMPTFETVKDYERAIEYMLGMDTIEVVNKANHIMLDKRKITLDQFQAGARIIVAKRLAQ